MGSTTSSKISPDDVSKAAVHLRYAFRGRKLVLNQPGFISYPPARESRVFDIEVNEIVEPVGFLHTVYLDLEFREIALLVDEGPKILHFDHPRSCLCRRGRSILSLCRNAFPEPFELRNHDAQCQVAWNSARERDGEWFFCGFDVDIALIQRVWHILQRCHYQFAELRPVLPGNQPEMKIRLMNLRSIFLLFFLLFLAPCR